MKKLALFLIISVFLNAEDFDYKLSPIKITENSYYFYGKEEYFSSKNGGDIANSAFIITKNEVIVLDTGSSYLYGSQVKEQIAKITNKPIKYVINTHQHPDHFLGNNAFNNVDIYASKHTKDEISENGKFYIENINNLITEAIQGTNNKAPNMELSTKELILDNYKLKILYFNGHTKSDIAILDEQTKVLYTSDLIFNQRALATPHANIEQWMTSLEELRKIDFKILVPGHGKMSKSKKVIDENIAYLNFIHNTFTNSAKKGLDIFEILEQPVPKEFANYSIFKEEFERSVINLYPSYEKKYYQK